MCSNDTLPPNPDIRHGVLANGMHYYIQHNAYPEHRAELWLALRAGSLQEEDNQRGVAHFVEHMAFNGTRHFPKNELVNYLERTGMRFGADLNAYTSFGETVYFLQVPTDSQAVLKNGLLILEDWAGGLLLDSIEIDRERGVVLAEWRTRLNSDQRLQQQYYPWLYRGSRFADRLPIGDTAVIKHGDYSLFQQFYSDWYRPELMAVIAVGDFDPDWMEQEIHQRFTQLENLPAAKPHQAYSVPFASDTSAQLFTDTEAAFTEVRLAMKFPESEKQSVEAWEEALEHDLFNRILNARLIDLQQQADPPFTFAYSGFGQDLGDNGVYSISVMTSPAKALNGFLAVYRETERVRQFGFTTAELQRHLADIRQTLEKAVTERKKTNSNLWASKLLGHFLQDQPLLSPEKELQLFDAISSRVTLDKLQQWPQKWLAGTNRCLYITTGNGAELPSPDRFLTALAQVNQEKLSPFEESFVDQPWLANPLPPVEILSEANHPEIGATEWRLANGVVVILKPTSFKADEVLLQAFSPGGTSVASDAEYFNAGSALAVAGQSGLGPFTYPDMLKKLAGKSINIGPYASDLYEGFSGRCAPAELEEMLQQVYLYTTQMRFDSTALFSYRERQRTIFANMMTNPYYFYGDLKERLKYANHPRAGLASEADLATLDLAKMQAFYEDRFGDCGDFTFVFVGNFDPDSSKSVITRYLGNLPATGRMDGYRDTGMALRSGQFDTLIVRGKTPKALVELVYHGGFSYDADNRYAFSSLLSVMQIRFREVLREEQGGVYGVRVSGSYLQHPKPQYRITLTFNADPALVDSLVASAKRVIRELATAGPPPDLVDKVREMQWQNRLKQQQENSYWLAQLVTRYREELPLTGISLESFQQMQQKLTPAFIQHAAKDYLQGVDLIQFVLKPEQ